MKFILIKNILIHLVLLPFYILVIKELFEINRLDSLIFFLLVLSIIPICVKILSLHFIMSDVVSYTFRTMISLIMLSILILLNMYFFQVEVDMFIIKWYFIFFFSAIFLFDPKDYLFFKKK